MHSIYDIGNAKFISTYGNGRPPYWFGYCLHIDWHPVCCHLTFETLTVWNVRVESLVFYIFWMFFAASFRQNDAWVTSVVAYHDDETDYWGVKWQTKNGKWILTEDNQGDSNIVFRTSHRFQIYVYWLPDVPFNLATYSGIFDVCQSSDVSLISVPIIRQICISLQLALSLKTNLRVFDIIARTYMRPKSYISVATTICYGVIFLI